MKQRQLHRRAIAVLALLAGCGLAPAAGLQDLRATPPMPAGDAQAGATKAATCIACHGPEGHSLVPVFPALAGQRATYLYLQLQQFKSGQRKNEAMAPFVAPLSDADMRDLASYFSAQAARPANAAGAANDAGQRLYVSGDPARGLPPCQGCHGPNGTGMQPAGPLDRVPWHSFPTLAGQQGDYVTQQLQAFRTGSRGGTTHAAVMQEVVRNMDEAAMQAVAAYIARGLPAP